jgi:Sec-independent protein secretion pathway component TatC
VLYELSVFVAQFAYRKRQKREAKREAEDAASQQSAGAPA